MFEDLEDDEFLEEDAFDGQDDGGEESGNRTFVIAAIALGALTIIALLCVGAFLFQQSRGGANRAAQQTEAVDLAMMQTQEADAVQMTVEAQSWTSTPTASPVPTDTPVPTEVVILPTATEEVDAVEVDPATATIAALLTQAAEQPTQDANALATITVAATELPDTGLFDDLNVTGMILLSFFALVVIFLARRMRTASR